MAVASGVRPVPSPVFTCRPRSIFMLDATEALTPTRPAQPLSAPRRTFAIISHPDAGKTTLTEKLLLFGGAIQMAGQVQGARRPRAARARTGWRSSRRAASRSRLGDDLRARRLGVQPARHAGPRRLQRGHLPHAERGRRGRDGDRRRQGHREPDAQAVRSVPPARHPDHHLHQQDRPRGPRPAGAARRDFVRAGARPDGADLAGRHGRRFPRHARCRERASCCCRQAGANRSVRPHRATDDHRGDRSASVRSRTASRSRRSKAWSCA